MNYVEISFLCQAFLPLKYEEMYKHISEVIETYTNTSIDSANANLTNKNRREEMICTYLLVVLFFQIASRMLNILSLSGTSVCHMFLIFVYLNSETKLGLGNVNLN